MARFVRPQRATGSQHRHRGRRLGVTALALFVIAAALTTGTAQAKAEPPQPPQRQFASVKGAAPVKSAKVPIRRNDAAGTWRAPQVRRPRAGTGTAHLQPGKRTRVGSLPVFVRPVGRSSANDVSIAVAAQEQAASVGVTGLLLTAQSTSVNADTVRLSVNYADIAGEAGGGFADRMHLVQLPACALTTPQLDACRQETPLATDNNLTAQEVTATVALAAGRSVAVAATTAASGSTGDYTATDLKPSGSWNAGGNTGSFQYSYPISVPPVPGAPAPQVALGYDSQTVDGEQAATNNQPSWIGDGWTYSPGYIERSYVTCSEDPAGTAQKTPDSCWGGQVVHISFGAISGDIVYDTHQPTHWRLSSDDGTKVELKTGGHNGTKPGDYWKLTSRDGTQFFFGRNQLPDYTSDKATPPTQSAWSLPVYNSPPDCDGATSCNLAWRWNLDYVVDARHNAAAYYYQPETNYYGANKSTTAVSYGRGGWLDHIDYGLLDPKPSATQAPARVQFTTSERCTVSATACDPDNFDKNKANWPDVPGDQTCTVGKTCDNHAPSFYTRKRLTWITTQVNAGGGKWTTVDTYALTQHFPDGGVQPALWLDSIQHTGGTGATAMTLPQVTFAATKLDNRVDGIDGAAAMKHNRVSTITTELGEVIGVQYETGCSAPVTVEPAKNSGLCYPVYWQQEGPQGLTLDWFHKYRVKEVDDQDTTGGAPTQTTSYEYLGGAGWHLDDNELVKAKYRTYGQFRRICHYQDPHRRRNRCQDPRGNPLLPRHGRKRHPQRRHHHTRGRQDRPRHRRTRRFRPGTSDVQR